MTPRFRPKYVCAKADHKKIANDSSLPANHSFSPERTRMEGSQLFSRSMNLSQKIGFVCGIFLILCPAWLFAQEPLRVGTIFSATQAPLWAAQEGRFFEKHGIKNLEVIQFSGGQPVTRALIGGDIQISTTGGAAVVNARPKGADTVIIAPAVGVFPYTLYVAKEIREAAELKGKKTRGKHGWRVRIRCHAIRAKKARLGPGQGCRHVAGGRLRHPARLIGIGNRSGHAPPAAFYLAGQGTWTEAAL